MDDLPASERLVHDLGELKEKAGDPSYAEIGILGQRQQPPVKLDKPKLSHWFSGTNVPARGRPFDFLIELLEARAYQRSGIRKRGIDDWRRMRKAADQERRRATLQRSEPPRVR
ncbi:hypothetical protein AB0O03_28970 [Streptomyces diastaticus]|uniref:hypothetical protein n=1 Tax=Streptomyces diastaticus TaxID=1956 RepID=UPI00343BEC37